MKNKLKKIFENAIWWSGVVMVGLILGISIQFVKAWTEPTVAPPGGNVGAPINTGNNLQTKLGTLISNYLGANFLTINSKTDVNGNILPNVTGKFLAAKNASGQVAWAAGGGGGSYEVYGTRNCGPLGYTDVYGGSGVAAAMYIMENSSGWKLSGGGGTICKAGGDFPGGTSGLFIYWGTHSNNASRDELIPCALCVK